MKLFITHRPSILLSLIIKINFKNQNYYALDILYKRKKFFKIIITL